MNDDTPLSDGLLRRMLERRSASGHIAGLEPEVRAALYHTQQRWQPLSRLAGWVPQPGVLRALWATAALAAFTLIVLVGVGVLYGPGESGAGAAPVSPSVVPSRAPSPLPSPSESPWPRPLAAGTNTAGSFWPSLTMTLPEGWINDGSSNGFFGLVPGTPENMSRIEGGSYPSTFLDIFLNLSVAVEDCSEAAEPGVDATASDIVGALAARPGLVTSEPVAVKIGGLSGQQIDFALAPNWAGTCPQVDTPFVPLVFADTDLGGLWWGASPGERFRIIVLDVAPLPSGMFATVMIFVYSADAAAWDDHLAASMQIIESFEFDVKAP